MSQQAACSGGGAGGILTSGETTGSDHDEPADTGHDQLADTGHDQQPDTDHGRQPGRGRIRPSRRGVLLAGLGVVVAGGAVASELVHSGALPGKYALANLDGACGSPPPPPRGALPAQSDVTFYSAYRQRAVTMVTLLPAGVAADAGLGVVVGLHGAGADARQFASQLRPAMTAARITGLAVVTVDGGDTYWHKRADGDDPVGMISHEVLPRLAAAGLRTARITIIGVSMGGYGALLLAEQLAGREPGITAVAALSPAIFATYADAVAADPTSFDGPADFTRHDVTTDAAALRGVPTWISCGTDDPFEPEVTTMRARLAAVSGHSPAGEITSGCHDDAFWARNLPAALAFLAGKAEARKAEEGR
jgi:acetyl esterase/lipase